MRFKKGLMAGMTVCVMLSFGVLSWAQDSGNEAAMALLTRFLSDPSARADYASSHPEALKAERNLSQFPPEIQKRIEKVVLMIMQESESSASRHVEVSQTSGAEAAFRSFSPAVQREIEAIARELEKYPDFAKKRGT